jgi:hypothetical protein
MESKKTNTTPIKTNKEDRLNTFKSQLEYYLSDENLKRDKFFHEKISGDSMGYLDVENILACNKIKAQNATKEEILEAAKMSKEIEVSGDKIRRSNNKPLPELKMLARKTKREDTEEKDEKDDREAEESFDPVILQIHSNKEPETFKWKTIQEKFRDLNENLKVSYLRFNYQDGHIGVFNNNPELKFTTEFVIDGVTFTVSKCEGDELINFWKDHGSHFEMCIGRNKKFDNKKRSERHKKDDRGILKNPVTLGDETFTDVGKIKSRARRILSLTKDGEKISHPDHDFLVDLLKNHRNFDSKVKDIEFLTTGRPSEHNYSRCFFIVKKDNSQEDFSVHKCIERITNDNKKKK